jgi:hypothetical protein
VLTEAVDPDQIIKNMKYIKRFNEDKEEKKSFDKDELEFVFGHTFDLAESHEIDTVYFGRSREWANNDFSNPDSEYHPSECIVGFSIEIEHDFYETADLNDFEKYTQLLNELKNDIERFKSIYNPSDLFFEERSNNSILILIRP